MSLDTFLFQIIENLGMILPWIWSFCFKNFSFLGVNIKCNKNVVSVQYTVCSYLIFPNSSIYMQDFVLSTDRLFIINVFADDDLNIIHYVLPVLI